MQRTLRLFDVYEIVTCADGEATQRGVQGLGRKWIGIIGTWVAQGCAKYGSMCLWLISILWLPLTCLFLQFAFYLSLDNVWFSVLRETITLLDGRRGFWEKRTNKKHEKEEEEEERDSRRLFFLHKVLKALILTYSKYIRRNFR